MDILSHFPSPSRDKPGFALLYLGNTRLLLPRGDVKVLEPAADIEPGTGSSLEVGWIRFGLQRCPVYHWSEELEPAPGVPAEWPVCAVLHAGEEYFGLLCRDATLLNDSDVTLHELPASMAAPGLPFHRLALHAGSVACVSSAAGILADIVGKSRKAASLVAGEC